MKNKIFLTLTTLFLFSSCGSSTHRGVVAMKIDDSVAHVGMGKNEVQVGDHVELYGNRCVKSGKGEDRLTCTKVNKGHGQVIDILGENYVSVKFDKGVSFEEGDFIEKHSH